MFKRNYVHKMIARFAADDQNRTALMMYDGQQVTEIDYRGLAEKILCAANYFNRNGLTGRHIALIGGICQEWLIAFFAIAASGNVVVPVNPGLPVEMVLAQCAFTDVSVICGDHQHIAAYAEKYLCVSFATLSCETPMVLEEMNEAEPDATAMLLFTSGTTGNSKAVEISFANLENSVISEEGDFAKPGINRIMMALPMFHIAGIRSALTMLYRYKTLCIGRGMKYLFRDMPVLSPDYITLVPLIVESLIKIVKRTSREDLRKNYIGSNLKWLCIGGATIDVDSCRYLVQEGFVVDNAYALSETTGVGTWGKWNEQRPNTIGRLSEELQFRIVDGELQFKGDAIMKGYYKDPEATKTAIEDGWLHTGDLGFCDEDGFFYLTGRKKDLILMPNGEKLNPEEIERHFTNCDGIVECLARLGERDNGLCIEVVAKDQDEVRKFVDQYNERMPLSYNIRKIVYRDKLLERTINGKLIRKDRS